MRSSSPEATPLDAAFPGEPLLDPADLAATAHTAALGSLASLPQVPFGAAEAIAAPAVVNPETKALLNTQTTCCREGDLGIDYNVADKQ